MRTKSKAQYSEKSYTKVQEKLIVVKFCLVKTAYTCIHAIQAIRQEFSKEAWNLHLPYQVYKVMAEKSKSHLFQLAYPP